MSQISVKIAPNRVAADFADFLAPPGVTARGTEPENPGWMPLRDGL